MSLSIEEVLAVADDRQIVTVVCPEWHGAVCLLPYGGDDRDWLDQFKAEKMFPREGEADWMGMRAAAVARAWCNEKGERTNATAEQVLALGKRSGAALDRCFAALSQASGLGHTAAEKAEKN